MKLANGDLYEGHLFGADKEIVGEVVFNTAMTGYPESLTDPSYKGQILVCAFPLIGNYGVPGDEYEEELDRFFESNKIQIRGLVISYESAAYSHWNAVENLSNWLKRNNIPGIYGVDTRQIIKTIRSEGSMLGSLGLSHPPLVEQNEHWVALVSTPEEKVYNPGGKYNIGLVDCGVKHNIIRSLVEKDCEVHLLPFDYDYNERNFDGIFLSNGPGNPEDCQQSIEILKRALSECKQPIYGICLGNQLMSLAAGAQTYKLKFGHRGHNQPVQNLQTGKCYITSQNHGYAVNQDTLPEDWELSYVNLNDGSCEGIKHKTRPYLAVQFHPEAFGGPTDTEFIFNDFIEEIKKFNSK